jgi:hypothetical protein
MAWRSKPARYRDWDMIEEFSAFQASCLWFGLEPMPDDPWSHPPEIVRAKTGRNSDGPEANLRIRKRTQGVTRRTQGVRRAPQRKADVLIR